MSAISSLSAQRRKGPLKPLAAAARYAFASPQINAQEASIPFARLIDAPNILLSPEPLPFCTAARDLGVGVERVENLFRSDTADFNCKFAIVFCGRLLAPQLFGIIVYSALSGLDGARHSVLRRGRPKAAPRPR